MEYTIDRFEFDGLLLTWTWKGSRTAKNDDELLKLIKGGCLSTFDKRIRITITGATSDNAEQVERVKQISETPCPVCGRKEHLVI